MKLTELAVLLPCHSLEDFPVYHDGTEADELLTAWCALWHPALLAAAGSLPQFHRVDVPPELLEGMLMTVPPFCVDRLPAGFVARAESESAGLLRHTRCDEAVEAAESSLPDAARVDAELTADFVALGFCRLQIELLTRQMRYSVNIDEAHFQTTSIAAASAAVAGQAETARQHLSECFETLYEARTRFYPVDVYLVDLALVAQPTDVSALRRELAEATPTNLLGTQNEWATLADEQADLWANLTAAIDRAEACVVGGEITERALPLLPPEIALRSLSAGVAKYEALLGRLPHVYARRRAGLWPGLPQMLVKLGYQGALHFALDDGRFPLDVQSKTRWEGLDSSTIDAYCQVPSDAAKPETLLGLSRKMADSMDNDHVATVAFAHWPGTVSPWYDVLRRVARLSPVLGKFMLLDDFFAHTDMPGRLSKFEPDQYRTPYLKQAIVRGHRDAISAFVREHTNRAETAAVEAVGMLGDLMGCGPPARHGSVMSAEPGGGTYPPHDETIGDAVERLASALPQSDGQVATRYLVVNPLSFKRQVGLRLAENDPPPAITGPVVAAGTSGSQGFAMVEVPAVGFAWFEPGAAAAAPSRDKPIAVDNKLSNEFFDLSVSRKTGGIQSIYDYGHRGNQLSQQIAFRLPAAAPEPGTAWHDPNDDAQYSTMRADSVEVTAASSVFGEITSRGRLVDNEDRCLAAFVQRTQVWAASRVITVEIELDELVDPRADPWNSYFAVRFAWPDATAQLWRGVGLGRHRTDAVRLEAPEYVDIEAPVGHMTILTGGHPYHRRAGDRMLDSLLVVRGESARRFRMGIGVDLPQPAAAALELLTPATVLRSATQPGTADSGWFFHVDAKNVVATHWEPIWDDPSEVSGAENVKTRVVGFRVRLMETAGRAGRVGLHSFRALARARQTDFLGQTLVEAAVEGDQVKLDFAAYEWIQVEARWAD